MERELDNAHGATRVHDSTGGVNQPGTPVTVTFDGRSLAAFEGEPLIAALIASGVRVLRYMPRTGEARGGYCLVGRCSDCMMTVDGRPNVRVCVTPVREGMAVETQRGLGAWPVEGA